MSNLVKTIQAWAATQKDKSQAKLEVQSVQKWLESLGVNTDAIIAGTEKLPALPPNLPAWATTMANGIQSTIDVNPGNAKMQIADFNNDLTVNIKTLTDEIGTYVAPDEDATPSETASLANLSQALKLASAKPNNETVQQIATLMKEMVPYVKKIKTEAVETYKKDNA